QFVFAYSDLDGATTLTTTELLFNTSTSIVNACYLQYDRASNQLRLFDDTGSTWNSWNPGAPQSLSNSSCTVFYGTSAQQISGNTLTLTVSLSFSAAFAGTKAVYGAAQDTAGGDSGWVALGSWSISTPRISNVGIFRSGFFWLQDVDGNRQFNSPPDRAFAF